MKRIAIAVIAAMTGMTQNKDNTNRAGRMPSGFCFTMFIVFCACVWRYIHVAREKMTPNQEANRPDSEVKPQLQE